MPPPTSDTAVTYGPPSQPSFQQARLSRFSFEDTIARLKQAIDAEGLWLIHEIDPRMLLKRGGFRIQPARQLLFFHPRYVKHLLETEPSALIEAPLKLVVMQMPDDTVSVRCFDARMQFGRYPGLDELAKELALILERLLKAIEAEE